MLRPPRVLRRPARGPTWTSDTIIVTRSLAGTWEDLTSGGTTFGAIDLDDPSSWGDHWTLAGDTVRCEIEDANGDLQSVTAVSGFCSPDITLIHESSRGRARQITRKGRFEPSS